MFAPEFELKQMHINAASMPLCIGKLRKVAHAKSNWEYYYATDKKCFLSVAKPESGARTSYFGNMSYMRRYIMRGGIRPADLTKYGRRLLKV